MANIVGTEAPDFLFGTPEDDWIEGLGGSDWLEGGDANDVLHGGADDDTLVGGAGLDIYRFNCGGGLSEDAIEFGVGINLADVEVSRVNDDLILALKGTTDSVLVVGYFSDPAFRLAEIRFADGAVWDAAAIDRKLTASSDFLQDTEGSETFDGGLDHDFLVGGGGDGFLYGDAGNDWLSGAPATTRTPVHSW